MKKLAVVFFAAVIGPSLVLGWLAMQSLRNQEIVVNSQRALLHQTATDALAADLNTFLDDVRVFYGRLMNDLLIEFGPDPLAKDFDRIVRGRWEQARIGCAVAEDGRLLRRIRNPPTLWSRISSGRTGFFSPTRPRPRCISRLNPRQTGSWSRMPGPELATEKDGAAGEGQSAGEKAQAKLETALDVQVRRKVAVAENKLRSPLPGGAEQSPRRPRLWIWRENRVFRRMTRRLPRSPAARSLAA